MRARTSRDFSFLKKVHNKPTCDTRENEYYEFYYAPQVIKIIFEIELSIKCIIRSARTMKCANINARERLTDRLINLTVYIYVKNDSCFSLYVVFFFVNK